MYWNQIYKKSFALGRFTNDHTLNNEFYWHVILTRQLACKYSINLDPKEIVETSAHVRHPERYRFPHKFLDWKKKISDKENWVRLNTLLASTAYLEQYIYELTLLALSNDPGLLIGKTRVANGVHFLKNGIKIKGLEIIEKFTKGTWNSRYKYLKDYFVFDTEIDKDKINDLEKIRKLRNKIAHRFGRDFVTDLNHFTKPAESPERISEARLKTYLKTINETALFLDSNIYKNHVANFEIILFWHNWDKKEKHKSWGNWTDARKLKYGLMKHINGQYVSTKQIAPIVKYYEEA